MILKRLIAESIDVLIAYFGILFPLLILCGIMLSLFLNVAGFLIIVFIMVGVYLIIKNNFNNFKKFSASFGYRTMKLKIVNLNDTNLDEKQSKNRSVARIMFGISMFMVVPPLIHFYFVFSTRGEKSLLDIIMKTKAIKHS
jgi:uncharacterized RDD family membrane protein YckC